MTTAVSATAEAPQATKAFNRSLRTKALLASAIPLAVPLIWAGVAAAQGCSAG